MTSKQVAGINAVLAFCFWLSVLYAGADHPPPSGFILIVVLVFLCALLVYWRVPTYIQWHNDQKKYRWLLAIRDGVITGLIIALLVTLVPGTGEPSVNPTMIDRVVWYIVLGVMGAFNTTAIYGLNALIACRLPDSRLG